MAKKKTTQVTNADASSKPEQRPADLRYANDGSKMLDAKTLAEMHGPDVLKANEEKARRIRAEQGE